MTIFEFSIPAGKDQRFASEALRHQIGGLIPINTPNGTRTTGRILDAKPNEDGTALLVTVETEEALDAVTLKSLPHTEDAHRRALLNEMTRAAGEEESEGYVDRLVQTRGEETPDA